MLTTKLRLSMLETPIAQIPLDNDLTQQMKQNYATCKLDVYPFSFDDEGNLKPENQTVFPSICITLHSS